MKNEIPTIDISNVIDKKAHPFFFSYDIISIESNKMQHSIQFGMLPMAIVVDGSTSPSIRFSLRIWKFECSFGMERLP